MRLYQYWDTGPPPEEVSRWIDGFRLQNPEMKHRAYDRDAAAWFIRKRLGERHASAFQALLVPSIQSDYFRTCALVATGGIYADADFQCLAPLAGLIRHVPELLLMVWDAHLATGFLMARSPDNPYLRACLELATRNIEARRFTNLSPRFLAAQAIAGPDLFTSVFKLAMADPSETGHLALAPPTAEVWATVRRELNVTESLRQSVARATRLHYLSATEWIGTPQPAYKKSERHWMRWRGPFYAGECEEADVPSAVARHSTSREP